MKESMLKKADEILRQMTIEEKVEMFGGVSNLGLPSCERVGIRAQECADGPLGLRMEKQPEKNCTAFPCGGAIAATWNTTLVEEMGECIANDCIKYDKAMILGPGVNLKRTPLCGRNFEYFSEDPVLAGRIAAAYIRGVERQGVSACIKHFVANNQELYRGTASVDIDERTLRDLYLKVFQIAIEEGDPTALMLACNRVNGIYNVESRYLMREVVRDTWGFNGIEMSDWYITKDAVISLKNGLNLAMPKQPELKAALRQALADGRITEAELDEAIRPTIAFLYGREPKNITYDRNHQHEVAKRVATEGIVLLKNENALLPITPEKYKKIAVVGGYAKDPVYYGYGSARVYTRKDYVDVPIDKIEQILDGKVKVSYVEGYNPNLSSEASIFDWRPDFIAPDSDNVIKEADLVVMFLGHPFGAETEDTDLDSPYLYHYYSSFIQRVQNINKNIVIVLQTGTTVIPHVWNDQVSAVVQMWMAGEAGGSAIADVLCGKVSPSGKLSETMAKKMRTDLDYPGNGWVIRYNERWAIGYRYYDEHPFEVAYPFGHGLSYTTFAYRNFVVEQVDDQLRFTFTIKNTGGVSGKEAAQIYFAKPESYIDRPQKELLTFAKTRLLAPGESEKLTVDVPVNRLSYFNVGLHKEVVESGHYHFLLGASATDIRQIVGYEQEDTGDISMGRESFITLG